MSTKNDIKNITVHNRQAQVNLEIARCINEISKMIKSTSGDPLQGHLEALINAIKSQVDAASELADVIENAAGSGAKSE